MQNLDSETLNAAATLLRTAGTLEDDNEKASMINTAKTLLNTVGVQIQDTSPDDDEE